MEYLSLNQDILDKPSKAISERFLNFSEGNLQACYPHNQEHAYIEHRLFHHCSITMLE